VEVAIDGGRTNLVHPTGKKKRKTARPTKVLGEFVDGRTKHAVSEQSKHAPTRSGLQSKQTTDLSRSLETLVTCPPPPHVTKTLSKAAEDPNARDCPRSTRLAVLLQQLLLYRGCQKMPQLPLPLALIKLRLAASRWCYKERKKNIYCDVVK
jgi:hypothetical protein